jgi:dipeptidyl aminopeptidase/acylaminoacyl peptidase
MPLPIPSETAFISDQFTRKPITGLILSFHGLGFQELRSSFEFHELEWAAAGGLVVFPYYGPWSWMNRQARAFIDDLVTAVFQQYQLPAGTPVIVHGSSMGGLAALLYARYAKHKITACCAVSPVTDLKHHFTERPDLPRTVHHAFRGYPEDINTLFAEHSPLAQAPNMPDIPYFAIHGDNDKSVSKTAHGDPFVAAMRKANKTIDYLEVPDMGHGKNIPLAIHMKRIHFVKSFLTEPAA